MNIYSFVLLAYALMSWVPGLYGTKIGQIIVKISHPYVSLFERLPKFAGLDFSVLFAMISLQLIQQFIRIVIGWIFGI
ncbi:YggT family protein [Lactococcus nasutitermitis]|uniref:YggT family protein n=2 Tax=Lactococcus nasutitermitis TaxID=1652957 RepID=A0ABV9JAE4_9LACT|nr:YggT family protein [Lactococcus nasutitermitis]